MRLRVTTGQFLVLAGLLSGFGQAVAAPSPIENESVRGAVANVLWVEVTPGPAKLESESIRIAIEKELGVSTQATPERPPIGRVRIEGIVGSGVVVQYESADGTTQLERRVALPVDASRRALVISWVVGNLVRNEAAEILSGLSKQKVVGDPSVSEPTPPTTDASDPAPAATAPASTGPQNTPHAARAKLPEPVAASRAAMLSSPPSGSTHPPDSEPDLGETRVIHLALLSPVVALHGDADRHRYHLSFGGVYSHVGAVDGLGLSWFVDHLEHRSRGALISGLWAQASDHRGAIITGIGVRSGGSLDGTEITGITSLRLGCVRGAQLAGVFATAASRCQSSQGARLQLDAWGLRGFQLGGLVAHVEGGFQGAQLGGATAIATQRSEGAQLAGVVAVGPSDFQGAQISGATELLADEPDMVLRERLCQGVVSAVGEAYDLYHQQVRAFARRLVGDEGASEDLVQEVFVTLPTAIRRFRGEASIKTFLLSIAVNHSRHHVRSALRRRKALQNFAACTSMDEPARRCDDPEDLARRKQLAELLQRALDELPLEQRVAFVLCEVEERPSPEVASIVGAPEATVRTRLFHARKKLRSYLEQQGVTS